MKKKNSILALIIMMAYGALSSCSWNIGKGDIRDRNIENVMLAYLDSIPGVEYIGLSDAHSNEDGNFQAVIIFNVPDSMGNMIERNARVTTNDNCTEIFSWEDLSSQILANTKEKVNEKMKESDLDIDESLIDVLINLKKQI